MALVPVEEIEIAQWEESDSRQEDNTAAKAWIVGSKTVIDIADDGELIKVPCFRMWTNADFVAELRLAHSIDNIMTSIVTKGGFVKGRALSQIKTPIRTCGGEDRPKFLYRVVHRDNPHGGTCARSYGEFGTNPLFFQIHLQKHLNWNCHLKSPFMGLTRLKWKLRHVGAHYEARGYKDIELLTIDTTAPQWDHSKSRLWHIGTLLNSLGLEKLSKLDYLTDEYAVEDSIPPEAVTRRQKWDDVKTSLDPTGGFRRRQRSRWNYSRARKESNRRHREAMAALAAQMPQPVGEVKVKGVGSKRCTALDMTIPVGKMAHQA